MVEFILYVADQERSKCFYEHVLKMQPLLHVPGMTEFLLADNCKLGLMPEKSIVKILRGKTPDPASGNGMPRCELYLYTTDINSFYQRLVEMDADEISPIAERDWGDRVCYFSDPDGHVLAIAEKLSWQPEL